MLALDEFGNALLTCMPNVMIWKKLIPCLMNFLVKIWPHGIGNVCQMWSSRKSIESAQGASALGCGFLESTNFRILYMFYLICMQKTVS